MNKGIKFALLTTLISGFSIFYGKLALAQLDPLVFTTLKNGFVAIFLSVLILTPNVLKELKKMNRSGWIKLLSIGVIGGGIPFALFFTGLSKTPAVNAALIHKTLFIWVAILAIPILCEKLTKLQIAGYLFIFLSNFWLGGFKGFSLNNGELMILGATFLWAVENILAKKALKNISPSIVAWARMTFGLFILLVILASQGKLTALTTLSPAQLQIGFASSLLLTAYVLTWYKALSKAPATLVSSVLVGSTVITNILTIIFIEHSLPTINVNTILLMSGIALIALSAKNADLSYRHERIK